MSEMLKCPACSAEIENDSWYCDQCGGELKLCPACRKFGRGNFCGQCRGSRMVPAKDAAATAAEVPPLAGPRYLFSAALNARLELKDGAVVGRRAGDYVSVFGTQGYISGTHARIQRNLGSGLWEIADLGSSNGTFLNGRQLAANQPAAFKKGDVITFYDIKFTVE